MKINFFGKDDIMLKSIIAQGSTTNEAIEKGLKELNVARNMVDIKVLEEEDILLKSLI